MRSFQESFKYHMKLRGVGVTDVARGSGVSKDKLHKVAQGRSASTMAEDAMAVAAYFGMTLNDFCAESHDDSGSRLRWIIAQLSPAEAEIVEAQLQGLIAARHLTRS